MHILASVKEVTLPHSLTVLIPTSLKCQICGHSTRTANHTKGSVLTEKKMVSIEHTSIHTATCVF